MNRLRRVYQEQEGVDSSWNTRCVIFCRILKVYEESTGDYGICGLSLNRFRAIPVLKIVLNPKGRNPEKNMG